MTQLEAARNGIITEEMKTAAREEGVTEEFIRQGIADAWGASSATGLALQGISKRPASKAEKLYVTGTGTTANPGLLTWEGPLQTNDVSRALNEF